MKKQNFKFSIQYNRLGRHLIKNVKAYSFEEAKEIILSENDFSGISLVPNNLPIQESEKEFYLSVNPIRTFS